MTEAAGPDFAGLDRFACRAKVVEKLREQGLLVKVEDHDHAVGHCYRCKTVIEPHLSWQWFVRIKPLADEAIRVVEDGSIEFIPGNWAKTYFEWMYNIHDWCISRQLWWGHRIPAWYCRDCGRIMVAMEAPAKCDTCGGALDQDEDVLDTWFSSALWPFSTLGWPDETEDLETFYPTDLMSTGFDIIFFWVARMIMMGLKFRGRIPFRHVFINGLVRDLKRRKMSKSEGNIIDPLEMIDKYGTDALRFTLAALAVPGMDLALSEERMAGYQAFANKIWNASRFVLMNLGEDRPAVREAELTLADRWIRSRLAEVTAGALREPGAVQVLRSGRPHLPLHLARVLRLVHRVRQGRAPGRQQDDRGRPGRRPRPHPAPPPSVHALHHRRDLAAPARGRASRSPSRPTRSPKRAGRTRRPPRP